MSVFLIKTKTGHAIENNGVVTPIDKIVDGGKTFKLPTNDANRQYFNIDRFEKNCDDNGRLELTYKPSVTIGAREGTGRTVKPLEDWLSDEDRVLYLELKAKAQKARDEANTKAPMTKLEKAQRRMERAQKALEKLMESEGKLLTSENKEEK